MKILLVSVPLEFPLANYCLAAQLAASPETRDCQLRLVHLDVTKIGSYDRKTSEIWRYLAHVEDWQPDLIAFSVYLWNHLAVWELVSITRKLYPDRAVVIGGPEVATPEAAAPWLDRALVSAVVRGEGELALVELVSRLRAGERPQGIPGCSWRDGATIVHEPRRPPVSDLSELSSPYLTGWVPEDLFTRFAAPGSLRRGPFGRAMIETYRGCYMQCSYCQWGNGDTSRSSFPLSRVKAEISWLLEHRVEKLWIVDAMFGFKKRVAKEILRHIIAEQPSDGPKTSVGLYHNQDFCDEELLDLYREANVTVEVDLQSTDPDVLRRVGRDRWPTASFERHTAAFRNQQVPTNGAADLIIGLPGDNLESFSRSVDYLLGRNMNIMLYQTSIIPDTPMSRSVEQDGIVFSDIPPRAVLSNATFSTADMIKARLMGHGVEFFGRFPQVARLLWPRRFSRPSEFCLHFGQLLWDEHELMYGDNSLTAPALAGAEDLVRQILPKLCPETWLLPLVSDLFELQVAAVSLLAERPAMAPSSLPANRDYASGDRWLSDRPRVRREVIREVPLGRRVDLVLQSMAGGTIPGDDDLRAVPAQPVMALVYLHLWSDPQCAIVDLDLTHRLLERLGGQFTVAECLDSLGRQLGRTWRAEELGLFHQQLSNLVRLGLVETTLTERSWLDSLNEFIDAAPPPA